MSGPILLNARAAARVEISGVERVARQVVSRLLAMSPDVYVAAAPRARVRSRLSGQVWEQLVLPVRAARLGASVVYSPANVAPLACRGNVVVLHDAAVWRTPRSYSRAYATWHRTLEAASARAARRVVTVSEFSRGELIGVLGLEPDQVVVVPNGVDERFKVTDPEPTRHRYALTRPYILTVATADHRKNLEVLEFLCRRLAPEGVDVVWVGGRRPHMPGGGAAGGVRMLGYVPDGDLPGLYAGAAAFVLPSRYEGFGLTCIEAMACGTPVVAANRAALPETCDNAALLADPDEPEEFLDAVQTVLSDEHERARLRAAGLGRASQLSWADAARRTDALLREVATDT